MDDENKPLDYFRSRPQARGLPDATKMIGIMLCIPIVAVGLLLIVCGVFGVRETMRLYTIRERPADVVVGCALAAIGVLILALITRLCWKAAWQKQDELMD